MKHDLDIAAEHCPMTMVKVKLKLSELAAGEQLDVLLKAGEPLENVPRAARENGHEVLSITQAGDDYHVLIEKRA